MRDCIFATRMGTLFGAPRANVPLSKPRIASHRSSDRGTSLDPVEYCSCSLCGLAYPEAEELPPESAVSSASDELSPDVLVLKQTGTPPPRGVRCNAHRMDMEVARA